MKHRTARITLALVLIIVLVLVGRGVASAYDLHAAPDWAVGINEQYEDGSFIISVGSASVTGCTPFTLCSRIGIDSPWEDFMPEPFSDMMYQLVSIYKFVR